MSTVTPVRPTSERESDLAAAAVRLLEALGIDGRTGLISGATLGAGDAVRRALARARALRKSG